MVKNITVFTSDRCSYCHMVKTYLKSKNMGFEEINLDQQPAKRAEVHRLSGALTVPVTIVTKTDDSQEIIVGYNLSKLVPAVS